MEIKNYFRLLDRTPTHLKFLYLLIIVASVVLYNLVLTGFRRNERHLILQSTPTTNTNSPTVRTQKTTTIHPDLHRYGGRLSYKHITFYPPDCGSKLLVYVCNADRHCGGLADRQKGMISTFILAILTNRTFVINNTAPCDMETHLPPNMYDWTKCRSKINAFPNDTLLINDFMLGWGSPFTFPKFFKQYNGSDLWKESVVEVKVNTKIYKIMRENPKTRAVLPGLEFKREKDILKDVMELLFTHSNDIRLAVNKYQEHYFNQKYLICTHFRVGAKGAERTYLDARDISNMVSFMASHILDIEKQCVVYIATDSAIIKERVKRVFPAAISLNSTIGHIDVERKEGSCDATFTSVLEQAILAECDSILLTWSGFSRMATLIGGKASHIFVYQSSKNERTFQNFTLYSLAEGFGIA